MKLETPPTTPPLEGREWLRRHSLRAVRQPSPPSEGSGEATPLPSRGGVGGGVSNFNNGISHTPNEAAITHAQPIREINRNS